MNLLSDDFSNISIADIEEFLAITSPAETTSLGRSEGRLQNTTVSAKPFLDWGRT